jgi:hypothetical protein
VEDIIMVASDTEVTEVMVTEDTVDMVDTDLMDSVDMVTITKRLIHSLV